MKNPIYISFIIIFLFANCKKRNEGFDNLNSGRISCIGHGGMGSRTTYPMDSYESVMTCINKNMDGSEFDLQLCKDSVLILFHDPKLEGTTNLNGEIHSLNSTEIKKGNYNEYLYINYSLCTVEDILQSISNPKSTVLTFDCKMHGKKENPNLFYETYTNALIKLTTKYDITKEVNIESDDEEFLVFLKNKYPSYKLYINSRSYNDAIEIAIKHNLYGITISSNDITKEQVKKTHERGLRVALWNVGTFFDNKKAIEKQPDFIQTDDVINMGKRWKK